jgi:predicted lipid-binding transport protein (Tim44 family)
MIDPQNPSGLVLGLLMTGMVSLFCLVIYGWAALLDMIHPRSVVARPTLHRSTTTAKAAVQRRYGRVPKRRSRRSKAPNTPNAPAPQQAAIADAPNVQQRSEPVGAEAPATTISLDEARQLATALRARMGGASIEDAIRQGFGATKGGGAAYKRARFLLDLGVE